MLLGLTSQTTPQQIIYSAYEAVCYQTREILESLQKDCATWPRLEKIIVGGELSENSFFLQLLADLCGITIGITICERFNSWRNFLIYFVCAIVGSPNFTKFIMVEFCDAV
jgi:glycerol kinase